MNPPRVPPSASGQLPAGAVQTPAGVFSMTETEAKLRMIERLPADELAAYAAEMRKRPPLDGEVAALQARAKARGVTI